MDVTCDHKWVGDFRLERGCRCLTCGDMDRPYMYCSNCDEELEPEHVLPEIWRQRWDAYWDQA